MSGMGLKDEYDESEDNFVYSKHDDTNDTDSPAYSAFKKRIARELEEFDDNYEDSAESDLSDWSLATSFAFVNCLYV